MYTFHVVCVRVCVHSKKLHVYLLNISVGRRSRMNDSPGLPACVCVYACASVRVYVCVL